MITGEGPVAFEMMELIHRDFAARASNAMAYSQLFEEVYQRLPVAQRTALEKRY
jgi:hypothetical protein